MNTVIIRPHLISTRFRQTGAATLAVALVLLFLVTMVGAYTSRTVIVEQKIAGNDFRTRQAFEAAESGLHIAMAYITETGGADKDENGLLDPVFDTNNDGIGDAASMVFDNSSSVTVALSGAFPQIGIRSDGVSDDRTATRTIRAMGSVADSLPNSPGNPLTTRGTVIIDGSATTHNPEGSSTIWSGSNVELGSNNATATNIADPADAGYPACLDTPMTCSTTRSSTKVSIGLDVIEHDTSLLNLTSEQMFENFFGLSTVNYRESRVTLEVDAADVNNLATNETDPGIDMAIGEIVWVEGNAVLSDNLTVGCAIEITGNQTCPNASLDPTILIVNGDLTTSGTPHFYGIVFVLGNIDVSSNSTVTGALVSTGDLTNSAGGSLDIWYNSDVLDSVRDNGRLAAAPGSWRDW